MAETTPAYQVLARKYRPQSFDDLLGHDAMVRTLRNAFTANRIAHAFILTGVRGVGKTTTARIMARALNYETDEVNAPTVDMPVEGRHCRAIAESRHSDIIEMDAASRTGVGDIRELIDGVRYAPVESRYKVYIIDEVHMLSNNAFNALLKTLEEPPAHVKFIFATTELRKVPVTVLSRCQRFDLRRFEAADLSAYLGTIASREKAEIDTEALHMIARAAEGSVRDGLSLLDQAILQQPDRTVTPEAVRDMLGLVDRTISWSLLESAMTGEISAALDHFRTQYNAGGDPAQIIRDLLDITHLLTRTKAAGPDAAGHGQAGEVDIDRAKELAGRVTLPALTRLWSLLMKALDEARHAPDPAAAAEIGLIRIAHAANLPTPDEAVRMLKENGAPAAQPPQNAAPRGPSGGPSGGSSHSAVSTGHSGGGHSGGGHSGGGQGNAQRAQAPQPDPAPHAEAKGPALASLAEIAQLASSKRAALLCTQIENCLYPISIAPGRLDIALAPNAPRDLPGRLTQSLKEWTGEQWIISVVPAPDGATTIREDRWRKVEDDPIMKSIRATFPDAEIKVVRPLDTLHPDEADDDHA